MAPGNNRVQLFDAAGNYRFYFGSTGSAAGQFKSPGGIAVNATGGFDVVDQGNSRVELFDSAGNYRSQFPL